MLPPGQFTREKQYRESLFKM